MASARHRHAPFIIKLIGISEAEFEISFLPIDTNDQHGDFIPHFEMAAARINEVRADVVAVYQSFDTTIKRDEGTIVANASDLSSHCLSCLVLIEWIILWYLHT